MAFPDGATTILVTGTLTAPVGGGPRSGRIVFNPSARLVDSTQQAIYSGAGTITLDGNGQFTARLLCTDDPDVQPEGWRWQVDEQPAGGKRAIYWIDLPSSLGPTVDLSEIAAVDAPNGGGSGGTGGAPTGPAGGALTGTYPNPSLAPATIASFDPVGAASTVQGAAAAALAAHATDTSNVHGIADTAVLETQAGAQAKANSARSAAEAAAAINAAGQVAAHVAADDPHGDRAAATQALTGHTSATTSVHGIADTASLETQTGAQAKATAAQTAAISTAAADATAKVTAHVQATDPHGDRAYTDTALSGRVPTTRQITAGTGLTGGGTLAADRTLAVTFGTTSGTVAAGDDARFPQPSPWRFDVSVYGAKGDARVVADGAMAAGSAVLTSATAAWPADIVGKPISVKGAAATGVTTLVTTVASRQSATQITLAEANASGGAVSGAVVIWGTDDTAAIQAAVNAAEAYLAAGNSYAQVYIPPRPHIVAGPLNTSKSGNGQIVFGAYPVAGNKKILEFRGETDGAAAVRHWQQQVPQYAGSCLISLGVYASAPAQIASINTAGNPGVISGPNEGFGYGVNNAGAVFSNMQAVIRDLVILTTHSAYGLTYGAANLWGVANAHVENLGYGTAGVVTGSDYASPGVLGTGLSVGLLLPAPGNNDHVIAKNVGCGGGYTYAMFLTEHAVVDRYMALYCWAGLVPIGTYRGSVGSVHAMLVLSASIETCVNELYILGAGSQGVGPIIDIVQLSTESGNPNIAGSAAAMAAARGTVRWAGLFTEANLVHDNPTGIESVDGQAISPVRTVTASTTARPIDRVIKADATSGAVTVGLPSAAPNPVTYTIIKADGSANPVTVDPFGAQTVNGATSRDLTSQWETVTLRSDGTNWILV